MSVTNYRVAKNILFLWVEKGGSILCICQATVAYMTNIIHGLKYFYPTEAMYQSKKVSSAKIEAIHTIKPHVHQKLKMKPAD